MIGKELGQYKVLAEIGRGGMGIVYKAYQVSLNRDVALKILPPALSSDENLVKRFHREAEAAARLSHPNIVQIFDINEIDGVHFFAMEYLKGETLTRKIEREGQLPIKEAVRIMAAVADALSYSHAEGIIHRDIKPGNIMIEPHGHVKVTDFGLARAIESSRLTMTGTIIGTPEYMSPEQACGENLDGRSDIYSLGMVFYEALTGRIPFEAGTPFAVAQKQIYEALPSPRSIRPEIPEQIEAIILKATQKAPQARYHSGGDFKKDLEAFIEGRLERITPTVPISPGGIKKRNPKKIMLRMFLCAAAAVIIITILKNRFLPSPGQEPAVAPEEGVEIAPEEAVPQEKPEISEEEPASDVDKKMIEEVRHLISQGAYADAISRLNEFMEKFPEHPQTNLIPKWIEELQVKEIEARFNEAQSLADNNELVQAILEFNQIARDYPDTEWAAKCAEKVEGLKKSLKEVEAQNEFLKAQELKRNRKIVEAIQLYQSIISRFPETGWAEKAEKEIDRLKEAEERFRKDDKGMERPLKKEARIEQEIEHHEPFRPEPMPVEGISEEAEGLIEEMRKADLRIDRLVERHDDKKLAGYLWIRHKEDLEKLALALGIQDIEIKLGFAFMVSRYLMGDDMAFERIKRGAGEGRFRGREEEWMDEKIAMEDAFFEDFRDAVSSNNTVKKYIEQRDVERMSLYLMSRYYNELKEISKKLDRPLRDVAWQFSERLVHEKF